LDGPIGVQIRHTIIHLQQLAQIDIIVLPFDTIVQMPRLW